jgi:hypothetical protein
MHGADDLALKLDHCMLGPDDWIRGAEHWIFGLDDYVTHIRKAPQVRLMICC